MLFCLWFQKPSASLAAAWPRASPRAESDQRRISRCYFVSRFKSIVPTWRQLGLEHLQEQNPFSVAYLVLFCLWFWKHGAYLAAAWPWASSRAESGQRRISRCYFVSGFKSMVLTWRQLGLEHLQKQNLVSITYLASFCLWFRKHCAYLAAAWPWASRRAESIQRRISSVILSLVSKARCLPGVSLALSISKSRIRSASHI